MNRDPDSNPAPGGPPAAPRKAGWRQVAATMFWGLLMIGKKGTWEREGVTLTPGQVLTGAALATVVVITLLLLLVRLAVA